MGKRVDLLIICGDFQAIRNVTDLECMACPDKYKQLGGFYRYYTGERVAPIPTIFVGGNHEAGNHMRELYY
ncbi:lariat debranching enzyme, partial [Kickxella alabastrina]